MSPSHISSCDAAGTDDAKEITLRIIDPVYLPFDRAEFVATIPRLRKKVVIRAELDHKTRDIKTFSLKIDGKTVVIPRETLVMLNSPDIGQLSLSYADDEVEGSWDLYVVIPCARPGADLKKPASNAVAYARLTITNEAFQKIEVVTLPDE